MLELLGPNEPRKVEDAELGTLCEEIHDLRRGRLQSGRGPIEDAQRCGRVLECVQNVAQDMRPGVVGGGGERDDGEVGHACDERCEQVEFDVGVPGVVACGNVESLGMFTQGSRADKGAFARGGTHQRARERGQAAGSADVDGSVEIGYCEVPPLFADSDEGACSDEGFSEGGTAGSGVDGADEAGVGVDVWDERTGGVRGVAEDAEPEFRRELTNAHDAQLFHVDCRERSRTTRTKTYSLTV